MHFTSAMVILSATLAVEVRLHDGDPTTGQLKRLNSDIIEITVDGRSRRIVRNEVSEVRFDRDAIATGTQAVRVEMIDGSRIHVESATIGDKNLEAVRRGEKWSCPTRIVRAVQFASQPPDEDTQWQEIASQTNVSDALVIRRDGALDYLKGTVLGMTADTIQFDYDGSTIPVPISRSAGVIFARTDAKMAAPRARVLMLDGSLWLADSVQLNQAELRLTSIAAAEERIPLELVSRIEFPQLDAVFLASLEPTSIQIQPFFGSTTIGDALNSLYRPSVNAAFDGGPLRIRDAERETGIRTFRNGLALHSRTLAVYRLAASYRRFRATAGVDPAGPPGANLSLTLYADNSVAYERTITADDQPCDIDLDVTGVNRLRILVDYGENLDVGDRLHLGNARLMK